MSTPPQDLKAFADKLIEEKGLTDLDVAVRTQVRMDLLSRMEDRINAEIIANLPKEDLPAFERMLDTGNERDIRQFCAHRIAGLDEIVARTLLAFRQIYLAG
ncbi:MAG: hypothetical protein AAB794_02095 [Patescibacteria group bacterium]|mgnify:CR=1 FL=1